MTTRALNIVEADVVLQSVGLTRELLEVPNTPAAETELMLMTISALMARLDLFDHYFQRLEERLTAVAPVCKAAE